MRRYRIRMAPGDRISVQVSPYDLSRGRIVYGTGEVEQKTVKAAAVAADRSSRVARRVVLWASRNGEDASVATSTSAAQTALVYGAATCSADGGPRGRSRRPGRPPRAQPYVGEERACGERERRQCQRREARLVVAGRTGRARRVAPRSRPRRAASRGAVRARAPPQSRAPPVPRCRARFGRRARRRATARRGSRRSSNRGRHRCAATRSSLRPCAAAGRRRSERPAWRRRQGRVSCARRETRRPRRLRPRRREPPSPPERREHEPADDEREAGGKKAEQRRREADEKRPSATIPGAART